MQLKNKSLAIFSAAALLFFSTNAALATVSTIENGDFQTGAPEDTVVEGWTTINERIDLGVDSIAGCLTVDTSDYTSLRDWYVAAEDSEDGEGWEYNYGDWDTDDGPLPVDPDPSVNNDSIAELAGESYETTLRDGNSLVDDEGDPLSADFIRDSNVLELVSSMDTNELRGYVVHGPAVYSEIFTAKTIDDLQFDWAASDVSDDYKVFGYLVNTDTCAQTEVLDSTGEISAWRTTSVAVPSNGNYRFVFVSGTFDYTFGTVAGAFLLLDDVSLVVNEERAEEEAAAAAAAAPTPTTAPAAKLATTGANADWLMVAGLLAAITGSGFLAFSTRKRSS